MQWQSPDRNVGTRMMQVLIGVDPHKASIALAALDEVGELVQSATFPQNLEKA
jgi:hypothetical protein